MIQTRTFMNKWILRSDMLSYRLLMCMFFSSPTKNHKSSYSVLLKLILRAQVFEVQNFVSIYRTNSLKSLGLNDKEVHNPIGCL